jgi:hypothetical protein
VDLCVASETCNLFMEDEGVDVRRYEQVCILSGL